MPNGPPKLRGPPPGRRKTMRRKCCFIYYNGKSQKLQVQFCIVRGTVPCRCHCGFRWRAKNAMDSQAHPLPHGLSLSILLCSIRFLRGIPFFSPTGMLMNVHCSAVQHQRCLVHQVLLNQGGKNLFPYTSFCPCAKPAIYTLPWSEALWQIPPWNPSIQPV